jgi:FdhD protein
VTRRATTEVLDGRARRRPDAVVTEEPLETRLRWPGHDDVRVAVTMRTPGADFELATGFLLAEGMIAGVEPPTTVAYCTDHALTPEQRFNVVTVTLAEPPLRHPATRSTAVSSACGVCGTQSLEEVVSPEAEPLPLLVQLAPEVLTRVPDRLREAQRVFDRTGGLHAAGVFSAAGDLMVLREDVGRHNAVDKVLGAALLARTPYPADAVLCVSGRVGFDVLAKAVAGRLPVVVAVGAPTSLALDLAERAGITVCGFARGSRMVVYTHPERIRGV